MQMQPVFMDEKSRSARMNATPQKLSIVRPEPLKELTPPIFDLAEHEDFYLLAVDLPGLPQTGSEIQSKSGELQITTDLNSESDPFTTNILFRCRALGNNIRSIYYEGQLWLLLPKKGHALQLRSIRDLSFDAQSDSSM